jgi:predicted SPOUT superfamily RNA methylase MTH1
MASEVDELKPIETGGLDLGEFEGLKKRIDYLEIQSVPSQFSDTGKTKVLKVITEPVTVFKNKKGEDIEIRASELFSLKYDDKSEQWGYSTSPKSRLQKLLKKCKVNRITDLKNKFVVVKVREVKRSDGTTGEFLGFHIE